VRDRAGAAGLSHPVAQRGIRKQAIKRRLPFGLVARQQTGFAVLHNLLVDADR
jgi:hypothetical protein